MTGQLRGLDTHQRGATTKLIRIVGRATTLDEVADTVAGIIEAPRHEVYSTPFLKANTPAWTRSTSGCPGAFWAPEPST